jgi:hypothetical protein
MRWQQTADQAPLVDVDQGDARKAQHADFWARHRAAKAARAK